VITNSEVSSILSEAFNAALLLTGSKENAESAVLDGIAALEYGDQLSELLVVETVKSAIRQRADSPRQSRQSLSDLPAELQRLFLLPSTARDCFILRHLLRISPASSAEILRLTLKEIDEALFTAFQQLPFLQVCS